MVTIVDYGVGNIGAILNAFDYLGIEAEATSDSAKVAQAERLILPGVGSFDVAMKTLRERGLIGPLNDAVVGKRVPVLGVCLGMQLLARTSEEGTEPGLGWVCADVRRIPVPINSALKVPNIGWRTISVARENQILPCAVDGSRFYFAHSYHICCDSSMDEIALLEYGSRMCCAVAHKNIFGVQFHPEKSHRFGLSLLKRFGDLAC
jgi:glutamine amidotransferase